MILFVDGIVVFVDFRKGQLTSRMREIVYQEQVNNRRYYEEHSVTITSGLTVGEYKNVGDRASSEIPIERMIRETRNSLIR